MFLSVYPTWLCVISEESAEKTLETEDHFFKKEW
jgi:hypothetical protein